MRHNPKDFITTQKIIDTAFENKITYIETCNFYLNSKCEEIAARALEKYPRESYHLCAKLPAKGTLEYFKDASIIFEQQLKTLNTDYFDTYLLQALDKSCFQILLETGTIQYLLKQKAAGRIKRFGFSFHDTAPVLEQYLKLGCFDVVQIQLNYYDWYLSVGKDNYEMCRKYDIPIIVMGPTKGGTLINNLPLEARSVFSDYKAAPLDFFKRLDGIETILTGANTTEMLLENINYMKQPITYKDSQFEEAINIYKKQNFIQCTGCGYCNDCPVHINIKKYFYNYNQILLDKNYSGFEDYMAFFKESDPLQKCINCGRCEHMCPQHLPIRELFYKNIFQMRL